MADFDLSSYLKSIAGGDLTGGGQSLGDIWHRPGQDGFRIGAGIAPGSLTGEQLYGKLADIGAQADQGEGAWATQGRQVLDTSGAGYRDMTGGEKGAFQQYGDAQAAKNSGEFDFGNVLLAAAMAGVGALGAGAFGGQSLGNAFSSGTAAGAGGAWNGAAGGLASGAADAGVAYGGGGLGMDAPYYAQGGAGTGGNMGLDDLFSSFGDFGSTPVETQAGYTVGGVPDYWSAGGFGSTTPTSGGIPNADFGSTANYWNTGAGLSTQGVSALQKLLSGGGSKEDAMSLLGKIAPGLLAAYGANQQSGSLQAIADRARADRQPALDKFNALLAGGPAGYAAGDGSQAVKGVLQGLSAKFGNPIGSGTALQLATDAGLADYRGALSTYGNLGLGFQAQQAGLDTNAATAGGGAYTGLASALGGALTPQNDLASLLAQLKGSGLSLGTGSALV